MTQAEKINAMYELELAINKLTRLVDEHEKELYKGKLVEEWYFAYEAKKLAESLTWTKLAISHMLNASIKAVK